MEEVKKIIEPGRENDPLTIEGQKLHQELEKFCEADKTRGCMVLLFDKTGGVDFIIEQGGNKDAADELLEAANIYDDFLDILRKIINKLRIILKD